MNCAELTWTSDCSTAAVKMEYWCDLTNVGHYTALLNSTYF